MGSRKDCGVSTDSRLLEITGLFCRISSLLYGSFVKETYRFKEPTNRSHTIQQFTDVEYETRKLIIIQVEHTQMYDGLSIKCKTKNCRSLLQKSPIKETISCKRSASWRPSYSPLQSWRPSHSLGIQST